MAQIMPTATPGRLRTSTSVPSLADPAAGIRGRVAACAIKVIADKPVAMRNTAQPAEKVTEVDSYGCGNNRGGRNAAEDN